MHVALLTCSDWLDEELAPFLHLCVGLFDEQVRITQVMPQGLPVEDAAPFGERVAWCESMWGFLRRRRLSNLAPTLADKEITVVHALSGELWRGALDLSEAIQAATVLTVRCEEDLDLAEDLRRPIEAARAGLAATTQPLAHALKQRLGDGALIRLTAPGVHASDIIAPARAEGTPFCGVLYVGLMIDASGAPFRANPAARGPPERSSRGAAHAATHRAPPAREIRGRPGRQRPCGACPT